jgi:hypothetical protein
MHFASRGLEMRLFSTFKNDLKGVSFDGISLAIRMQTRVAATSMYEEILGFLERTVCGLVQAVETRFGRRIGG